jgi:hypothetical protein
MTNACENGGLVTAVRAGTATVAAGFLWLACVRASPAGIILGQHDWDDSDPHWQSDHGFASLEWKQTGGNPDGWLQVTFPGTTPGGPQETWWDIAYTDAGSLFAGGWETNMWTQFDFWSTNNRAPTVQVRWQSVSNNYVWAYDVSGSIGDGWNTLRAPLTSWTDWDTLTPIGASEEQYLDDLASIDWIGVYIYRHGIEEQTYGIDDFQLMVPEPGEYVLLGAAMALSGLSLRRRKRPNVAPWQRRGETASG